jgi:hypothetical protein
MRERELTVSTATVPGIRPDENPIKPVCSSKEAAWLDAPTTRTTRTTTAMHETMILHDWRM